jgi:thiol-disulfide isomerase/thioredoxin
VRRALFAALAACAHAAAPAPAKTLRLNAPGAMVDVAAALVTDYVTIVDFWSESCGACKLVAAKLAPALAAEPRVVVREVDVGDGVGALATAYEITALPHYNVYDRKRRLRFVLVGPDCMRAPELARQLVEENDR